MITGSLTQLPELVAQHGIVSPSLIVIGEVAALANTLGWYQHSKLLQATSEPHQHDFDGTTEQNFVEKIKEAV